MKVSDFDYELPQELIAQKPKEPRDSSRLLIVDRRSKEFKHTVFKDLPQYLNPGDVLVLNDTAVYPARLKGKKAKTGGQVEVLLLTNLRNDSWEALVKPAKRLREGTELLFDGERLKGKIVESLSEGRKIISFRYRGVFDSILNKIGEVPLPPYIQRPLDKRERYQTIYSQTRGSAAAPTAGLHFTSKIMTELKKKGVKLASVTLNIGLDTFRPVTAQEVEKHSIHKEHFRINSNASKLVNQAISTGKRTIAVGTTATRAIESAAIASNEKIYEGRKGGWKVKAKEGMTGLFIYPGYKFRIINGMLTNFHLPKSTLLMMVSAFAGNDLIRKAYQEAIFEKYQLFTFGDVMLII